MISIMRPSSSSLKTSDRSMRVLMRKRKSKKPPTVTRKWRIISRLFSMLQVLPISNYLTVLVSSPETSTSICCISSTKLSWGKNSPDWELSSKTWLSEDATNGRNIWVPLMDPKNSRKSNRTSAKKRKICKAKEKQINRSRNRKSLTKRSNNCLRDGNQARKNKKRRSRIFTKALVNTVFIYLSWSKSLMKRKT